MKESDIAVSLQTLQKLFSFSGELLADSYLIGCPVPVYII